MSEYSRFRWVPPVCFIVGFLMPIAGPFLFPRLLIFYLYLVGGFGVLRGAYILLCAIIGLVSTIRLKTYHKEQFKTDHVYAWVIPTVNEDKEILYATLRQLAKSTRSKEFIVVLAFQDLNKSIRIKADTVVDKFKDSFRYISYTLHQLQPDEAKGKASNVSWCVQCFQQLMPKDIDLNKVFVTILDSDSTAPVDYIEHVNAHLYKYPEKSHSSIFIPTMIFKKNDLDVPLLTRSFDHFHCLGHYTSTVSLFRLGLAFSNYTLSYKNIKEIGFWDTGKYSITQDLHMTSKMFWAKSEEFEAIPIYTPFIQSNIQSGDNYINNIRAKYIQSTRHAMGLFQVSYTLQKFAECKKKTFRRFAFTVFIFEALLYHAAFTSFAFIYQTLRPRLVGFDNSPAYIKDQQADFALILNIVAIINAILIVVFDAYKRYSFKRFHGGVNQSLWRIIQYFFFSVFGVLFLLIPTQMIAAFKGFGQSFEYVVAEKFVKKEQDQQ